MSTTDASSLAERAAEVTRVLPEVGEVRDEGLRRAIVEIWAECWAESTWVRLEDAAKNPSDLPQTRNLIDHVRSVTQQAIACARIVSEVHGIEVDHDTLLAGCLLHDVSKLLEYGQENGTPGVAPRGKLIQHGAYGAHKAWARGLSDDIAHVIISHTHSSRVPPRTLEAAIVHYVDFLDSDALLIAEDQPLLLWQHW